jgi:hypothetical protein
MEVKMKKGKLFPLLIAFALLFQSVTIADAKPALASVSIQVFYDELSPHGRWISYPQYGYVWIPGVDAGFRPYYTNGYWVSTDNGWLWMSDYDWGWAPFHYGSWFYDGAYGWIWVQGYHWAPAWVTWG